MNKSASSFLGRHSPRFPLPLKVNEHERALPTAIIQINRLISPSVAGENGEYSELPTNGPKYRLARFCREKLSVHNASFADVPHEPQDLREVCCVT